MTGEKRVRLIGPTAQGMQVLTPARQTHDPRVFLQGMFQFLQERDEAEAWVELDDGSFVRWSAVVAVVVTP